MTDLEADLREAFEDDGYDVASVSVNRDMVKIALLDDADPDALRETAYGAAGGKEAVRSVNIATEAIDGRDQLGTVVSFRHTS